MDYLCSLASKNLKAAALEINRTNLMTPILLSEATFRLQMTLMYQNTRASAARVSPLDASAAAAAAAVVAVGKSDSILELLLSLCAAPLRMPTVVFLATLRVNCDHEQGA